MSGRQRHAGGSATDSLSIVEGFIREHLATGVELNRTNDPGSHGAYIADAARRRGLRVVQVADGHRYFFSPDGVVGGVKGMFTSLVSTTAVSASNSKHVSKELFLARGLPVAPGAMFSRDGYEQALAMFLDATGPLVVKPDGGRAGEAVATGIATRPAFDRAWEAAAAVTGRGGVVVEEQVAGIDIRALVVGERVVAAASRIPAFVLGTGHDSVAELIAAKRAARAGHRYLARLPIVPDEVLLARRGHQLDSVPSAGEVVLLNGVVNLHQGGESVDVTARMHPELQRIAVEAARALPGLVVAGVDLMVPDVESPDGAIVLEVNAGANISVHHLPAYGSPVDVGAAIVDEMLRRAA